MTSIEWLIEQFNLQAYSPHIEQAKEMHKKEIEDAFQDGKWDWSEHITNGTESKDLEQYYQETLVVREVIAPSIAPSIAPLTHLPQHNITRQK